MNNTLRAVDVKAAYANSARGGDSNLPPIRPISLAGLPVVENLRASDDAADQAVLSWRWDVDPKDGTSRNVAAALAYAAGAGIEHLFVDVVSVDQTLTGFDLVRAVADFTALFGRVPVIAAYDSAAPVEDSRHFLRVLRRPWIAREILAMRHNPHRLRYVGHMAGQGAAESFGIAHMLRRIWRTTFVNSLLYVITGYCDMHNTSELQLIMPQFRTALATASDRMSRNDALLTAAILAQTTTEDFRVNGDIDIRRVRLKRYTFKPAAPSVGHWGNWEILLGARPVGVWSEKDYTMDGTPRRKLSAAQNAREVIGAHLNVEITPGGPDGEPIPPDEMESRLKGVEVIDLSDRFAT